MTNQVYILYSRKFSRFYVGVSTDVQRRLTQHNNKETPFTAGGVPWVLIWSTTKHSVSEAEILERKLKNLTRERKIRFMKKYDEGLVLKDILDLIENGLDSER